MKSFTPSSKENANCAAGTVQRISQSVRMIVDNRPITIKQRKLQVQINERIQQNAPSFFQNTVAQLTEKEQSTKKGT